MVEAELMEEYNETIDAIARHAALCQYLEWVYEAAEIASGASPIARIFTTPIPVRGSNGTD